ncbi:MAG: YbaB/EbfC family nucleoid-associated protein [Clostridia bacterium]|nr:YbaB/EbfC family nucleoid-associated protein [Clostridia bacterium]
MAKGGFPRGMGGMGGGNMNQMIKQAQKMQEQMLKMQEEMETKSFEATAGGGAVRVVISGKRELQEIELKPEVVDPDDVEMLQDLIVAAVNEGLRKMEADNASQMGQLTGGLNIPGLF